MTENIMNFVVSGVTYAFDAKMAHLGSVLVDALRGSVSDDVIMSKLCDNGVLDSVSNSKYRESKAQSRFDALDEKGALVTLAGEVVALAESVKTIDAEIQNVRSNFRVDVSAVDYSAVRADVTNVTRWAEMLKIALDAAKSAAESSLNSPNGDGVTKLSKLAGYRSAYDGKANDLRTRLDASGFQTHNLTADGKLVSRPATVKPSGTRKPGGKHTVSVVDKDGNKREFASRIACSQALKAEGVAPFTTLSDRAVNVWMTEAQWNKELTAAGLKFA